MSHPTPCPRCGHCPTCGRGGYSVVYPYWSVVPPHWDPLPWQPPIPVTSSPITYSTTTNADAVMN